MATAKRAGPLTATETREIEIKFNKTPNRAVTGHCVAGDPAPLGVEARGDGSYQIGDCVLTFEPQTIAALLAILVDRMEVRQAVAATPENSMALAHCRKALWFATGARRREVQRLVGTPG